MLARFLPSRSVDVVPPLDETGQTVHDEGRWPRASGGYLNLTAGAARVGTLPRGAGWGGASIEADEEVKAFGFELSARLFVKGVVCVTGPVGFPQAKPALRFHKESPTPARHRDPKDSFFGEAHGTGDIDRILKTLRFPEVSLTALPSQVLARQCRQSKILK